MISLPNSERSLTPLSWLADLHERALRAAFVGPDRHGADRHPLVRFARLELGRRGIADTLATLHPRHVPGPETFTRCRNFPAVRFAEALTRTEAGPPDPMRLDVERSAALFAFDLHAPSVARAAEQEINMPSLFDLIGLGDKEAA